MANKTLVLLLISIQLVIQMTCQLQTVGFSPYRQPIQTGPRSSVCSTGSLVLLLSKLLTPQYGSQGIQQPISPFANTLISIISSKALNDARKSIYPRSPYQGQFTQQQFFSQQPSPFVQQPLNN